MGSIQELFPEFTNDDIKLLIVTAISLPPVSLDLLILISSLSPLAALQILQNFVEKGILEVDESKGFGYYKLADSQKATDLIELADTKIVSEMVEKVSRHLEEQYGDAPQRWVALGHLQTISGIQAMDSKSLLKAAQFLRENKQTTTAELYFNKVLELLPEPCIQNNEKQFFIEAVHGLLTTRYKSMPLPDQKKLLNQARLYAGQINATEWQIRLSINFARLCSYAGDHQQAARVSDEAWELTETSNQEPLRKWVALHTAEFLAWEGRINDALERYENAIGNLEEFSSDSATLRSCVWLGYYYCQCGQTARGIGLIETVRVKADTLNHKTAVNWANILLSLALNEAGRLEEAESVCERLLQQDQDEFGLLESWLLKYLQAYMRFQHNDLPGCLKLHNQASDMLQSMGWWHLPVPLVLEYLEALEEAGMVPPKSDFNTLIDENLTFPDIFMQGVALRFRVQHRLKNAVPGLEDLSELEKSLDLLHRSGARLQRSYTQILMARILIEQQQEKQAHILLKEAWDLLSDVNEALFPDDLKFIVNPADREERQLQSLIEVGNALGTVREKNQLIRKIIQVTMNFSQIEKGAMFLLNSTGKLDLAASRNIDSSVVGSEEFKKEYALITEAATHGRELILDNPENSTAPLSRMRLPSVKICCPVMLGKRIFGVLYLESGSYGSTLSTKDLPFLRVLSNQVAVALDNIYAYEEIHNLKERLLAETRLYHEDLQQKLPKFGQIVGESRGMQNVFGKIRQVAETDATVLITGETGVGKELVARSVHQLSKRSNGPFIALNTAALDSNLVGSELFGHEKGAFTNAISTRLGRFELADKGTLFLDDVDNLKLDIQAKLLRVIQEKEFERTGGKKTIKSDFRLITATNRNLKAMVAQGQFREDLYYRLNTFPVHVPPLRERKEDIPRLAQFFLKNNTKKLGKKIDGIAKAHMARLKDYSWPGNVRELKHVVERASIISTGNKLNIPDLKEEPIDEKSPKRFQTLEEMEKGHIIEALKRSDFKVSGDGGAAELLDLKTSTLTSKMKKLGISRKIHYSVQ